jgi:Ser/Thr protein kinase RdoA (MazF antagonist)
MSVSHWGSHIQHFYELTPESIYADLEKFGLRPTGKMTQLNSLENRVYDVELSQPLFDEPAMAKNHLVLKYYRPGRWSEATLKEEHLFYQELRQYEVPIAAPWSYEDHTLFYDDQRKLYWCAFPKIMGRLKDEFTKEETQQLGRLIGRVHNIGKLQTFSHRPIYDPKTYLSSALTHMQKSDHLPSDLKAHYESMIQQLMPHLERELSHLPRQRLHGDFHRGNIMWTSDGPWITDLDDSITGPIEQDLWLLFPGNDTYLVSRREEFLEAYEGMTKNTVNLSSKKMEALRAMRMINFTLWISLRYEDPFFQRMFSHFKDRNYFEQHINDLRECVGLLQETSYF